jgi:hypothetical protein
MWPRKILLEQAWGRPPVMGEDGNALPDLIREMLVSEVRMVIVHPEDRDADREASPPRGDGAGAYSTGTSEALPGERGPGGHPGA